MPTMSLGWVVSFDWHKAVIEIANAIRKVAEVRSIRENKLVRAKGKESPEKLKGNADKFMISS
jgi:hypothetical protein